jgi:uncharacterized protein with HEPN domain
MPHDVRKCLLDIIVSIDSINDYLSRVLGDRRDFEIYLQDKFLRRAVERELLIIGEAVNRILQTAPDTRIDNARKIIGFRNRVIHAYDSIDDETVWSVATYHLAPLREDVERLLK